MSDAAAGGPAVRVVVLADTHRRDDGRPLPDEVWAAVAGCDAVLHAGDVLGPGTLRDLAAVAPTYAVLGNNDVDLAGRLPLTRQLVLGGVTVALVHDSGPRAGRPGRLRRRFPDAGIVVFGHSHQPCDEEGVGGQLLFNPGSPTQRRAQPVRTFGELRLGAGRVLRRRIVDLGP